VAADGPLIRGTVDDQLNLINNGCHLYFSISADHDRFVPARKTQSKIYVVENCKAINYSGGIN